MSSQTTNLHLVKPSDGEAADISVINGNMDTIDSAVGTLRESVSKTTFSQKATGVDFYQSGNDFAAIQISANDGAQLVIAFNSSNIYFERRQNGTTTRLWTK